MKIVAQIMCLSKFIIAIIVLVVTPGDILIVLYSLFVRRAMKSDKSRKLSSEYFNLACL